MSQSSASPQHLMVILLTVQGERRYWEIERLIHETWRMPGCTYQVVSGPAEHSSSFTGSYDKWVEWISTHYDVVVVPYRHIGKVSAQVAMRALELGKPVFTVFDIGLVEVQSVRTVNAEDYRSGWEIVPKDGA